MIQFICPKVKYGIKQSAVYKIVFDDTYFYIGSTTNLSRRFERWRVSIRNGGGAGVNLIMKGILPSINKVEFIVIEYVNNGESPKIKEDLLLKKYQNDIFSLNISNSAFKISGIKGMRNYVVQEKKKIKVHKIDKSGNLVAVFDSLMDAIADIGCNRRNFTRIFRRGTTQYYRGFYYKRFDSDGNYIQPKETGNNYIIPKGKILPKEILKFTTDGVFIRKYESMYELAKEHKTNPSNIRNQIKYSPKNYYKGFVYKICE